MARAARKKKIESLWSDLSEESIRCRVNHHRWKPYDAHRVVGAFETDEVCEQCGSHRESIISNTGEVLDRKIKYADGYLHEGGRIDGAVRNNMRLHVIMWDFEIKE